MIARTTTCANSSLNNENKISESAYLSAAKVVQSDKKRRIKRHYSNVLNEDMNSESESCCESKIGHSTSLSGAEAVHHNKKRRMQRQHSNVPNDSIYSESESSCDSRISESTSLSGAAKIIGDGNKKQKTLTYTKCSSYKEY